MIRKKYIFAVSMIVMFTVSAAVASAPATGETVADEHIVYTAAQNVGAANATVDATSGIAGVTYVNRMVNRAGNAAQAAEVHAAASGVSALAAAASANEAKQSATAANEALAGKFANTSDVKKAIVTTDSKGNVAPVVISDEEIGTYITGVTVSDSGAVKLSRGTPTAVNNATLTIQQNGTDIATFTANSSSGATANITVPTKVSELTNDSNYATKSELPTVNNATLTIKNGATDGEIVTFTANASSGATATIPAATASVAGLAKYGQIPSGSATSTEYATIWVE